MGGKWLIYEQHTELSDNGACRAESFPGLYELIGIGKLLSSHGGWNLYFKLTQSFPNMPMTKVILETSGRMQQWMPLDLKLPSSHQPGTHQLDLLGLLRKLCNPAHHLRQQRVFQISPQISCMNLRGPGCYEVNTHIHKRSLSGMLFYKQWFFTTKAIGAIPHFPVHAPYFLVFHFALLLACIAQGCLDLQ